MSQQSYVGLGNNRYPIPDYYGGPTVASLLSKPAPQTAGDRAAPMPFSEVLRLQNQMATVNPNYGQLPTPQFSQLMQLADTGPRNYQSGLNDNLIKRGSAMVDRAVQATPFDDIGAMAFSAAGAPFGMAEFGGQLGEMFPRGIGQIAAVGAGATLGGPAGWGLMGAAAADAFAQSYTHTDSVKSGLIDAGLTLAAPGIGKAGAQLGHATFKGLLRPAAHEGSLAAKMAYRNPLAQYAAAEVGQQATFFASDVLGQTLHGYNPFTKEMLFANLAGNVASLPISVRNALGAARTKIRPIDLDEDFRTGAEQELITGIELMDSPEFRSRQAEGIQKQRAFADLILGNGEEAIRALGIDPQQARAIYESAQFFRRGGPENRQLFEQYKKELAFLEKEGLSPEAYAALQQDILGRLDHISRVQVTSSKDFVELAQAFNETLDLLPSLRDDRAHRVMLRRRAVAKSDLGEAEMQSDLMKHELADRTGLKEALFDYKSGRVTAKTIEAEYLRHRNRGDTAAEAFDKMATQMQYEAFNLARKFADQIPGLEQLALYHLGADIVPSAIGQKAANVAMAYFQSIGLRPEVARAMTVAAVNIADRLDHAIKDFNAEPGVLQGYLGYYTPSAQRVTMANEKLANRSKDLDLKDPTTLGKEKFTTLRAIMWAKTFSHEVVHGMRHLADPTMYSSAATGKVADPAKAAAFQRLETMIDGMSDGELRAMMTEIKRDVLGPHWEKVANLPYFDRTADYYKNNFPNDLAYRRRRANDEFMTEMLAHVIMAKMLPDSALNKGLAKNSQLASFLATAPPEIQGFLRQQLRSVRDLLGGIASFWKKGGTGLTDTELKAIERDIATILKPTDADQKMKQALVGASVATQPVTAFDGLAKWADGDSDAIVPRLDSSDVDTPLRMAGSKATAMKVGLVRELFQLAVKGKSVIDAFSGSGYLASAAKAFGAKKSTLNVQDPEVRSVFTEMKADPDGVATRAKSAAEKLLAAKQDGDSVKFQQIYDELVSTDPTVAKLVRNWSHPMADPAESVIFNINTSRELNANLPDRMANAIREFASNVDTIRGGDGWKAVKRAGEGDTVLIDPPYVKTRMGSSRKVVPVADRLKQYEENVFPAAERGARMLIFDLWDDQLADSLRNRGFDVQAFTRQRRGNIQPKTELVAQNYTESHAPIADDAGPASIPWKGTVAQVRQALAATREPTGVFGGESTRRGFKLGAIGRNLGNHTQVANLVSQFLPEAPLVSAQLNVLTGYINRMRTFLSAPFVHFTGTGLPVPLNLAGNKKGRFGIGKGKSAITLTPEEIKTKNAIQLVAERPEAVKAYSAVARRYNDLGATEKNFGDVPVTDPRLQSVIELKALSPTDKLLVEHLIELTRKQNQAAAGLIIRTTQDVLSTKVAKIIQFHDNSIKFETLLEAGKRIRNATTLIYQNMRDHGIDNMTAHLRDPANLDAAVAEVASLLPPELLSMPGLALAIKHSFALEPGFRKYSREFSERPWFFSEIRSGKYFISYEERVGLNDDGTEKWRRGGIGAKDTKERVKMMRELSQRDDVRVLGYDRTDKIDYDAPMIMRDQAVEALIDIENAAYKHALDNNLPVDVAEQLKGVFQPGKAMREYLNERKKPGYMQQREYAPGREYLNMWETAIGYYNAVATTQAKMSARAHNDLAFGQKNFKDHPEVLEAMQYHSNAILNTRGKQYTAFNNLVVTTFLGYNLSSPIVEGTQPMMTVVPWIIRQGEGMSVADGFRVLKHSYQDLNKIASKDGVGVDPQLLADFRAAQAARILDWGMHEELFDFEEQLALNSARVGKGQPMLDDKQHLTNPELYMFKTMDYLNRGFKGYNKIGRSLYSFTSGINSKVAYIAAWKTGKRMGLQGGELRDFAERALAQTVFTGGVANKPFALQKFGRLNAAANTAFQLSNYTATATHMLVNHFREAIGRTNLPPAARKQALRAFGTQLGMQLTFAGILGLPGIAAAMRILEELFGKDIEGEVREGISTLFGGNTTIADVALGGAGHLVGVDVGARFGLGTFGPMNSYNGFDAAGMFGASGGFLKNVIMGASEVAQDPKNIDTYLKNSALPLGLKKPLELIANDGQFQDRQGNLLAETGELEKLVYFLGFQPKTISDIKLQNRITRRSEQFIGEQRSRENNRLAETLLSGDAATVRQALQTRHMSEGAVSELTEQGLRPQEIQQILQDRIEDDVQAVIRRAVDKTIPTDPLSRGTRASLEKRKAIASAFVQRQSRSTEAAKLQMADALYSQLTGKTRKRTPRAVQRAQMADELLSREPNLSRTEVLEIVDSVLDRSSQ